MIQIKKLYIPLLFILLSAGAWAQNGNIKGFVYDKTNGEPCAYANVYIPGTNLGAATDLNGYFNINRVPAGKYEMVVTYVGYDTLKVDIAVKPGRVNSNKLYLSPSSVVLEETVISAERKAKKTQVRTSVVKVQPAQIKKIPSVGGQPDIAQYLQVVPGVVFTGDQGGQLYIRGGAPIQNLVLLDGMVVYNPFHSIGLFSVFDSDIIRNADVYTGGFSAEYGGRMSSVMDITMRDGNRNRFAGKISTNPFGSKLLVEGPFKKFEQGSSSASYILSAKHSYLQQTSQLLYTYVDDSLPFNYTDLYGKISFNSPNGSKLNLFGFNFSDRVKYQALTDLGWNSYGLGGNFVIVPTGSTVMIKANMAYSDYSIALEDINEEPRSSDISGYNLGLDFVYFLGKNAFTWGLETMGFNTVFDFENSLGNTIEQEENTTELGVYAKYKHNFGFLILEPSVRIHYYASLSTPSFEPRLGVKYNINERLRLKFAGGVYSQNLIAANSDRDVVNLFYGFISGSNELSVPDQFLSDDIKSKLQTAEHVILGLEYDLTGHLDLNLEGYYKRFNQLININRNKIFDDIPENSEEPDYLKKDFIVERGHAYGADLTLKYDYNRLYLWFVYSLGWVKRNDGTVDGVYVPHFDRRHNLNFLGSYKLGKNKSWEINARWNLGSGFPFTKTMGFYEELPLYEGLNSSYWQMNGDLGIIYDELNEGRLPYYHRLDLTIKKQFVFNERMTMNIAASVTNVYNRNNIFYFDRVNYEEVYQLPIMPSLGINLTF